ncbi:hypothetical protein [Ensifer adhaerens]|uniref:hypothetical protein n=1 Tax=Ensifer adhaerens TaxID=106592 RepID=UPI001319D84C|nr:hypothetical protein [Ensifer adhaerens]
MITMFLDKTLLLVPVEDSSKTEAAVPAVTQIRARKRASAYGAPGESDRQTVLMSVARCRRRSGIRPAAAEGMMALVASNSRHILLMLHLQGKRPEGIYAKVQEILSGE